MHPEKKRRSTLFVWILCTICILFSRICFDDVQTDPYLACRGSFSGSADAADAERASDAAAFSAPLKGVQTQQVYVPENYAGEGYAYFPRKASPRTSARSIFGGISFLLLSWLLFAAPFFGRAVFWGDGLDEIISNTVILRYIHGQDGEKA